MTVAPAKAPQQGLSPQGRVASAARLKIYSSQAVSDIVLLGRAFDKRTKGMVLRGVRLACMMGRIPVLHCCRYVKECKWPADGGKPKSLRYVGSMVADVHRTCALPVACLRALHASVLLYFPAPDLARAVCAST